MGKVDRIARAMNINPGTGVSAWWEVADLEKLLGFTLRGNGSPFFQMDRGLGVRYVLEKQRGNGNTLVSVRTTGFASYHQIHRASGTPLAVRSWLIDGSALCSMCGTTSNLISDHKDGNKQPMDEPDVHDYQPLCQHCNTVKREVCKKCRNTGVRFDARIIGYSIPWVEGTAKFQPRTPRCRGCYWYSPTDFRKALRLRQDS